MGASRELIKQIFDRVKNGNTFEKCLRNVQILSAESGNCKAELKVTEEHLNSHGSLHGGFATTLIGTLASCAFVTQNSEAVTVAIDSHISYMQAAIPGDVLEIDAKILSSERTLVFFEVEIKKKNNGAIIARGQETKMITYSKY